MIIKTTRGFIKNFQFLSAIKDFILEVFMNFSFKIVITLLIGIFIIIGFAEGVSGQSAGFVNYQAQPDFQTYYSPENIGNYWPILNEKDGECIGRQDIILNVAPGGCQPFVVRSDLLADQNVPVFCQIDALQINPLINIKQLKNIRFTSNYPKEVAGVGFHPARAALRTRDVLLGSPLINNVGYVVVILKKTPNEKDMPNFVNLTLSAQMEYDAGNALGVGRAEFVLSPVSDANWEEEKLKNSFWNGRYFVRADDFNENFATISIYDGDRKISGIKLERGKSSRDIYMPGSFCMAALNAFYDGPEVGRDKATIKISDDVSSDSIDVYSGSNLYNNRCKVEKINIDADNNGNEIFGNVSIVCENKKINLERKNILNISLQNEPFNNIQQKSEFENAIASYMEVADNYPAEKIREAETSASYSFYGEEALDRAIVLAEKFGQFVTRENLLKKFVELYPNSFKINDIKKLLSEAGNIDASKATGNIEIGGRLVTFYLDSLSKPVKMPSAVFSSSSSQNVKIDENKKGKIGIYNITLDKVKVDIAEVIVDCKENNKEKSERVSFKIGEEKKFCEKILKLESVDMTKVAKVRLVPKAKYAGTQTNLSVTIGIEKRAIELSPNRAKKAIDTLNKTIIQWEKISQRLGKVVTTMKSACFATSLALTLKNLISGVGGTAMARQEVMSGPGGWKERCQSNVSAGNYKTMTACFAENSDKINKEIANRVKAIEETNARIANVESKPGISQSSISGGRSVDTNKAIVEYYNSLKSKWGDKLLSECGMPAPLSDGTAPYAYQDLRDCDYNLELNSYGYSNSNKLGEIKGKVGETQKVMNEISKGSSEWEAPATAVGLQSAEMQPARAPIINIDNSSKKIGAMTFNEILPEGTDSAMRVVGTKNGATQNYLVVGKRSGNVLVPSRIYAYTINNQKINLTETDNYKDISNGVNNFMADYKISSFEDRQEKIGANPIRDGESKKVVYFATGPDKGLAHRVPFELNKGWYARVDSSLDVANNIKAYDSSGLPKSWKICNVGSDGIINSNDECQLYIEGMGFVKILGVDDATSRELISKSRQALREANNQAGAKFVKISGQNLAAGAPVSPFTGTECQEFMSIEDCGILFNLCDPVVCPASRCNLGGDYPVADVIQTGVIGSTLLCLPNAGTPPGGVVIPVCLTGIQAGIDSWVSILKNHRDCLQENLNSGKMTGVCDEIYSFYMCDLFWKQVGPFVDQIVPSLIERMYTGGQGGRGGGEYLTVRKAWDNAQASVNYMTQTYQSNSLKLFQTKSLSEVGDEFCKMRISAKGPTALKSLMEPESPPQFSAWFSSDKYSDATVPATAQYKVFYHIFAGKNNGVYYSVYLKNPPESPYYSVASSVLVASGFAKKGEYASQTKDFTAPEGYRELCVRINNEEKCGFKQVSTSYAVNYLSNQYIAGQAQAKDITSEGECVGGGLNPRALSVNSNPQAALTSAVFPQDYERGIVRICSSINPGESTDSVRYADVGYCGEQKTRCWLDKNSVKNAISDRRAENETLSDIEQTQKQTLEAKGIILTNDKAVALLKDLEETNSKLGDKINANDKSVKELIGRIESSESELFYNHHKAKLALIRAEVFGKIARSFVKASAENKKQTQALPEVLNTTNKIVLNVRNDSTRIYFEWYVPESYKGTIRLFKIEEINDSGKIFVKTSDGLLNETTIIPINNISRNVCYIISAYYRNISLAKDIIIDEISPSNRACLQ